jgi:hypothetical protein
MDIVSYSETSADYRTAQRHNLKDSTMKSFFCVIFSCFLGTNITLNALFSNAIKLYVSNNVLLHVERGYDIFFTLTTPAECRIKQEYQHSMRPWSLLACRLRVSPHSKLNSVLLIDLSIQLLVWGHLTSQVLGSSAFRCRKRFAVANREL